MNKKSAALISIFSNSFLIIIKLISGILMGSISVLSEAIHSSLDLVASIIAFISIKESLKPKDKKHPFGHGKFENVSGFVEAILIFLAGGIILVESFKKLTSQSNIESLSAGIIVMLISGTINLFISMFLFKVAKREDSIALEADAMHLLTDVFTSFGVFLGLILIKFTGLQIIDPIVAIIVAFIIIKASIDLTKKSLVDLVDTTLPEKEVYIIESLIKSNPHILSFHNLRTRKSGPFREIDFHMVVDENISVLNGHEIAHDIKEKIEKEFDNIYIVIHIEPK